MGEERDVEGGGKVFTVVLKGLTVVWPCERFIGRWGGHVFIPESFLLWSEQGEALSSFGLGFKL